MMMYGRREPPMPQCIRHRKLLISTFKSAAMKDNDHFIQKELALYILLQIIL